ncbi:hypothetical protein CHS0354_037733 [Potamilus streckersoni]|uniref:Uncharacterized protein n=1 Tax=Potamilus streckersoni TaxID=2493646 RepID=A0AAE0T092_9BIVA|nr:hypothetical protein CHS0354_037733 [Potamilus streckersoni]
MCNNSLVCSGTIPTNSDKYTISTLGSKPVDKEWPTSLTMQLKSSIFALPTCVLIDGRRQAHVHCVHVTPERATARLETDVKKRKQKLIDITTVCRHGSELILKI